MTEGQEMPASARAGNQRTLAVALAIAIMALLVLIYWDGLTWTVLTWIESEEYQHGFLIPVVAFYLLAIRAREFGQLELEGSKTGLLVIAVALAGLMLGELSSIYTIIQYSFLLAVFGVVLAVVGWSGLKVVWVPLAYLVFMIPLPDFIQQKLSAELQLLSSAWGVAVIRAFGIPVFLEGNVIDLGVYQLQVAEACNGLRYLFPLMSFGFLCAALFRAPWWQRVTIFLSSVPLTIFMNSFRIGVIGILVDNFGIEQAEGFLHYFEGWIVFMACVAIMFGLMWIFSRINGQPMMKLFELDFPPVATLKSLIPSHVRPEVRMTAGILVVGFIGATLMQSRVDQVPASVSLSSFPLRVDDWSGKEMPVDSLQLEAAAVDDYVSIVYDSPDSLSPVTMWIAYYESQKKGKSVHSPRSCLPGGGWQIESLDVATVDDVGPNGESLAVNRAVIAKGTARQLVYYWFEQRGRRLTNEYMVKWYIFWDALTRSRTDGSLVRLTTFVPDLADMERAEARLQNFVRSVDPQIAYYLPQEQAPTSPQPLASTN